MIGNISKSKGFKGDRGPKGDTGKDGNNATIKSVSATVKNTTGTPNVVVAVGGSESERSFSFVFSGLKGEQGEHGEKGEKGEKGDAGTTNYESLDNKPSINGVELSGNLELDIPARTSQLDNDSGFISQETDPTIAKWAKAELFDKNGLKDYVNGGGFVTIDNVEYFRYHAGNTNFTYTNPNPQKGSVTITARAVGQYSTSGNTAIVCHYSDGTNSVRFFTLPLTGEIQTYTTPADKTLVSIKGCYDVENWILLDMSVMSMFANYPAPATVKYVDDSVGDVVAPTIENLTDNQPQMDKVYKKTISESTDFILPTVTDGKFHQILILATIENTPAITYGTDYYFNGVVPTADNGDCDIIFEYDGMKWTAGVISKGSGN